MKSLILALRFNSKYLQFLFEYLYRCCPSDVQMVSASHYFSRWLFTTSVLAELAWLTVRQRSSNCDTEGQSSFEKQQALPMLLASPVALLPT